MCIWDNNNFWNNVSLAGHNKMGFYNKLSCHFLWNTLISQCDFFFDHTISLVKTSYSWQHYWNNLKQLLWKCIWGVDVSKRTTYEIRQLHTGHKEKNNIVIRYFSVISILSLMRTQDHLKKNPHNEKNSGFLFLLRATGLKHTS